jgi:3-methylfumaryl-CoA hydratase
LDRNDPSPQPGDPLPPLWHWLFFLPRDRQSELGADGHAKRGGFLPPVLLPRRMWAGGRFEFRHPLRVGDTVTRTSRILDVQQKTGRTGPLVFVTVRHEFSNLSGHALTEEHDIVYRSHAQLKDSDKQRQPAPDQAEWDRTISPDDVLLFRYSALTFNGHRIHYDRKYATETEGYPGLVVHGPLIATLLADLLRRSVPHASPTHLALRSVGALFDTGPFSICGKLDNAGTARLWAKDSDGKLAMTGTAAVRRS